MTQKISLSERGSQSYINPDAWSLLSDDKLKQAIEEIIEVAITEDDVNKLAKEWLNYPHPIKLCEPQPGSSGIKMSSGQLTGARFLSPWDKELVI